MYCALHSDAPGIGICVACQQVICESCTTRLQGRNFCRSCLEQRSGPQEVEIPRRSGPLARLLVSTLGILSSVLVFAGLLALGYLLHWIG
ncbi:MAG: hypothetical protein VX498_05315 [Myxococcota bacterium]|nr:hypothetical protein [Myxococcota bacterium]